MKKKQIISYLGLILIHELLLSILYFKYSFLVVGWEKALARKIIIALLAIIPVIHIFSYRLKSEIFDKIIIIINWVLLFAAVIFALIKPYVFSQASYDIFLTKSTLILNPGISLSYIVFISTTVLIIPRLKKPGIKKFFIIFSPVLLWIILRLLFEYIKTPIFHG